MAQAGMHALLGAAVRKALPKREWLLLGILLGSILPDMDNYLVAAATVAKLDTGGLHRTFSHSVFTVAALMALFWLAAQMRRQPRWLNLGLGLSIGIGLHIALDLLIWFNGVELLWPLGGWVNLWQNVTPPEWWMKLMDPLEFLFFAGYFFWLARTAAAHRTDGGFLGWLGNWQAIMLVLFVVFTPLAYWMQKGFLTLYGALYLVSITAAFAITLRMRATIDAASV